MTQLEYAEALDCGVDVLPFLLDEDAAMPAVDDDRTRDTQVASWRGMLQNRHVVEFFGEDPSTLNVLPSVVRWMQARQAAASAIPVDAEWARAYRRRGAFFLATMATAAAWTTVNNLALNPPQSLGPAGLASAFSSWSVLEADPLRLVALRVALLSVVVLVVTQALHVIGMKRAELRLSHGVAELTRRIASRVEEPRLLEERPLRALVTGIENKYRSPLITDTILCEAIRAAGLAIEQNPSWRGRTVEALTILNRCLKRIDARQSPLLSLAVVDRVWSYAKSQPIAAGLLMAGTVAAAMQTIGLVAKNGQVAALSASGVLLSLQLCFLAGEAALLRYWGPDNSHPESERASRRMSRYGGLFLSLISSRAGWVERFWSNVWAGVWEFPYTFDEKRFLLRHDFRYPEAKKLKRELARLTREIEIARMHATPDARLFEQQRSLIRRLYVVTGDESAKQVSSDSGEVNLGRIAELLSRL